MPKEAVCAASLEVWSQSVNTTSLVEIKESFSDDWNVRFLLLTRSQMAVFPAILAEEEAANFLSFYTDTFYWIIKEIFGSRPAHPHSSKLYILWRKLIIRC